MITYWAPHGWIDDADSPRFVADLRFGVDGGRFTQVDVGVPAEPGDVVLDTVVLPGLANAHSHAFHRALRGRTQHGGGTFWTWRRQMYALAERLDPDRYFTLARAVYAEMVRCGYTAVGEFHYLHHDHQGRRYADPNAMGEALIAAADEAGLRLTLLDVCYLAGGLDEDGHQALDPVQERFGDGDVDRWQARVAGLSDRDRVRIGAAVHSVRAVPRPALVDFASAVGTAGSGKDHDRRVVHVHLSEQRAENDAALAHYGLTPTSLLAEAGLLGSQLTAVHGTHLSDADLKLLGDSRTGVCFCPSTEADLADGIGPARALRDAGSPISLGTDQHVSIDPFVEMRGLESGERVRSQQRGRFSAAELITAASSVGYAALGWDGGRIAVGEPADFVTVRTDSHRTAGADPGQLHYAATGADVDLVVVGGQVVVEGSRHRLGDVGRLLNDAIGDLTADRPARRGSA